MPRSPFTSPSSRAHRSLPTALTIKPGSGDFLLVQERKGEALVAIQHGKPTMTETVIGAVKRGESPVPSSRPLFLRIYVNTKPFLICLHRDQGANALMGGPPFDPSKTISAFTKIIELHRITDAQHGMIIDEMIKVSCAGRSLAKARAFGAGGMVGMVGVTVIASLGTAAWV